MGMGAAILGGALQGLGGGIAAQGAADNEERRQTALENLRASNSKDLYKYQTNEEMRRDAVQHDQKKDENVQTADLADRNDARKTSRTTASQMTVDNNQTNNEIILKKIGFEQAKVIKSIDFNNDVQLAQVQSALQSAQQKDVAAYVDGLRSGDVTDTLVSGDGHIYGLRKDGSKIDLGMAAPKDMGKSSENPFERVRSDKQQSKPLPKSVGKPAAQKSEMRGGYPVAKTAAEAQAIKNIPGNKGKKFYGPDGNLYQVP